MYIYIDIHINIYTYIDIELLQIPKNPRPSNHISQETYHTNKHLFGFKYLVWGKLSDGGGHGDGGDGGEDDKHYEYDDVNNDSGYHNDYSG